VQAAQLGSFEMNDASFCDRFSGEFTAHPATTVINRPAKINRFNMPITLNIK
jgi:hypothetical protein